MSAVTLKNRIKALMKAGFDAHDIAYAVGRPVGQVRETMWRIKNPKEAKEKACTYDAKRYGTEEYRKVNRDYVRLRRLRDPAYRKARDEAVARHRMRRRHSEIEAS